MVLGVLTASDPAHRLVCQPVESGHAHLQMLFLRVFDLVVTDAMQALHEHHDGRNTGAGHLGRVMQRTGWHAMRFCAGLGNGFIGKCDQLIIKEDGFDLPDAVPRNRDIPLLRETLARFLRFLQHLRERLRIEMALIERDSAIFAPHW